MEVGREQMRADVAEGLGREQKELSPKYFYDRRGSELFEEITRLPEYYPTRTERGLLREHAVEWLQDLSPHSLVELGAGAADKTTVLLDAMHRTVETPIYVPVDISGEFLDRVADALRREYPAAEVRPIIADMTAGFHLPDGLPRPAIFAILGGTIGNFPDRQAVDQLERIRAEMRDVDRFLMGIDLQKDVAVLEAAYDDAAGVTAAFNLNVLTVLNRELGADFDPEDFEHRAFYNAADARIEMHLVARRPVTVAIPAAGRFSFASGESVRTEVSCKYTRESTAELLEQSGLALERWADAEPGFALVLAAPA